MNVTYQQAHEYQTHRFVVEASTLGLRAGQAMPTQLETEMGNGQPFVFRRNVPGGWEYKQAFGCITLNVLND